MARPLVKIKSDGTPYSRIPAIETAIDAALIQDLNMLGRRAESRDQCAEEESVQQAPLTPIDETE